MINSSVDLNKTSLTVKALVASLIPVVKMLFGIELVSEQVNQVIDAVIILISAGIALYGYIRSRNYMQAKVDTLGARIGALKNELKEVDRERKMASSSPSSSD